MGIVAIKYSPPELAGLLNSLQAFTKTYLQKENANQAFLQELTQDIKTLERLVTSVSNNEDVSSDLIEFRKRIGTLIENNDQEFDENLLRQLTYYYSQDVKQKPQENIENIIKQIEKSKLYIPPTKTATVHEFESKLDDALKFLKTHEHEGSAKAQFVAQALPTLKTFINKMETETELTSMQANEMRAIISAFETLSVLYQAEIEAEILQESRYQKEIAGLPEASLQWLKKLNSLTQWYIDHAKYDAAEMNVKNAMAKVGKDRKKDFQPPKAKAWELYASSQSKKKQYAQAKVAYEKAANILKKLPAYSEYVGMLLASAKKAEAQEASIVLMHDKDIENLKRMQTILEKSGDMHLVHIANKEIDDLYNQLINAEITSVAKTQLLNEFIDRWHKYTDHRGDTFTKPAWYTPEMEQIIADDLLATLRMLRETFAAQNSSPIAMVEAKERAASEAQLRAAAQAKLKREEARAKAEAEQQAAIEVKPPVVVIDPAEQARADEAALIQARMREKESVDVRKNISKLMKEAKMAFDNAANEEEEKKLKEAVELFSWIKSQDHSPADLATFGKSLTSLGLSLRNQGKYTAAEEYFIRAINVYEDFLKKQPDNVAAVSRKVEAMAELARTYYIQRKYFEAEKNFDAALADIDKMLVKRDLDESFKGLFKELHLQNKARALLMAKMLSAEEVDGINALPNKDNMIETLYHAFDLRQKCNEEEMKLVHHVLNLDKNLNEKNDRVQQLQKIIVPIERPLFQKVILLGEILKVEDARLGVKDKDILRVYNEDLINLAFVEVLKSASQYLSPELQSFISEIKSIRNELRMGKDMQLNELGLSLEQKIVYLQYEKQLAQQEGISAENIEILLDNYLTQYINPQAGKTKSKKRWLGRVLSALRKKKR